MNAAASPANITCFKKRRGFCRAASSPRLPSGMEMCKIRAGPNGPGTIFCRTAKIELDEARKTCYDMQANLRDASVAQSVEQLIRN